MVFRTAGESHGKGIIGIFDRMPSNLKLDKAEIDKYLALRQSGYGRGGRQKIEKDEIEILSGMRNSVTLGSPLTFIINNRDYQNWKEITDAWNADVSRKTVTRVRPGHADYSGLVKFGKSDARDILERASARETAARVAGGAIARQFLGALGVEIAGCVRALGGIEDSNEYSFDDLKRSYSSDLFMLDAQVERRAKAIIDEVKREGDTLGGVIEIRAKGLKSGFGSPFNYTDKLDAKLAFAAMSVQAVKAVEFGAGFALAGLKGSKAHDEMYYDGGVYRNTNNAGGIEGGMSNGEEIVMRAAMKPIPTLMKGLNTFDYITKEKAKADTERSDVTAVPACQIVLESAVAVALFEEVWGRLGGDRMEEITERWNKLS